MELYIAFTWGGDRIGSKNGWYVFHVDDPVAGCFGCFKRGISETWSAKKFSALSADEKNGFKAKMEAARKKRDEETAKVQADCRKWCADRWQHLKAAANSHPYLKLKNVTAHGLRQLHDRLVVPIHDEYLTIHGVQFIWPDGVKRFKLGTDKLGHYFMIGKPKEKTLLICEGYATGASLHQATGQAVTVAFDAGNLKPVAEALRQKYPDIRLIVCADNDAWKKEYLEDGSVIHHEAKPGQNTGIMEATKAARAVGGYLSIPCFHDTTSKPTDFNDLHQLEGLGVVRFQVENAAVPQQAPIILETVSAEPVAPENSLPFTYRRMSEIQAKPIRWLWPGRIARGKVTMLAGHPGLGKSQLTANLAAIITTGGIWPVDKTQCEPGNVIFISAEDDAEDTMRPRLEAAGAVLERVYILDAVRDESGTRPRAFNLARDILRLGEMLSHFGDVAMVVIDPITAYLGGTDSHKNADMRALLSPLGELAAKHGAAVVCVSHLNKGGGGEALLRVTGSLAFVAASRAAFLIVRDNEDKHRRLLLPIKNNIGNDESGLAFSVESYSLPGGIETSRVSWEGEPVTITADEAMSPPGDSEERSALDDAKEFLSNLLADGPLSSRQIKGDAEGAGYAWRTIQRAHKALGIDAYKSGMKEGWLWRLPAKSASVVEERQANRVATFGNLGHLRQDTRTIYPDKDAVTEPATMSF